MLSNGEKGRWESIQEQRRQQIKSVCHQYYSRNELPEFKPTFQMLVDKLHKVMFCYIPKAACSSWKGFLGQVIKEGVTASTESLLRERRLPGWPWETVHFTLNASGLKPMDTLSLAELRTVIVNYTKIIAVRHPIQRLVSLYKNKFYTDPGSPYEHCEFCKHYGEGIKQRYRQNYTQQQPVSGGRGVKIEEFFRFVSDPFVMNEHWDHYTDLCQPCHIQYDYICKIETIKDDTRYIIPAAFNSSLPFPSSTNPSEVVNLTKESISQEVKQQLLLQYGLDLEMFGYHQNITLL